MITGRQQILSKPRCFRFFRPAVRLTFVFVTFYQHREATYVLYRFPFLLWSMSSYIFRYRLVIGVPFGVIDVVMEPVKTFRCLSLRLKKKKKKKPQDAKFQ
jgi:hypothetical protein